MRISNLNFIFNYVYKKSNFISAINHIREHLIKQSIRSVIDDRLNEPPIRCNKTKPHYNNHYEIILHNAISPLYYEEAKLRIWFRSDLCHSYKCRAYVDNAERQQPASG